MKNKEIENLKEKLKLKWHALIKEKKLKKKGVSELPSENNTKRKK